jgi:hypothetical protein
LTIEIAITAASAWRRVLPQAAPGLILRAATELNIDLKESYVMAIDGVISLARGRVVARSSRSRYKENLRQTQMLLLRTQGGRECCSAQSSLYRLHWR